MQPARQYRLQVDEKNGLQPVLEDLQHGAGGVRRIDFQGVDTLWAYKASDWGLFVALRTPYRHILLPARQAQAHVRDLLHRIDIVSR